METCLQETRCSACGQLYLEEELLIKEDDNQKVCIECSGLLAFEADEDLGCQYAEDG